MQPRKKLIPIAVAVATVATSPGSFAAGLAIGTQSGSGTGNAFAGGAAAAEDASTVWFNPAGMTALPKGVQLSVAALRLNPFFSVPDHPFPQAHAHPLP